jgi:hypothetical protein
MEVAVCAIYQRWLRRVSARLPVVDVRTPAQRWPVTWPMVSRGRLVMTADELDQLHYLWPEYWPPSSALEGGC